MYVYLGKLQCIAKLYLSFFKKWVCIHVAVYIFYMSQTGESLVEGSHYASDDIEARVEELFSKWEELLEATDSKRLGLEQALSLLHFNRKVHVLFSHT